MKYLYTPTVLRRGLMQFKSRNELSELQGFRSVFGYPEDTLNHIKRQGNTRDISHLPVYCDDLMVDFDDNLEAAERYEHSLLECGIAYEKYDSGNRSIHFHVPVTPCVGSWVPRAAYEYAYKYINGCDVSVYRHTGLFRLQGTWHEKNPGHLKRQTGKAEGGSLVLKAPQDFASIRVGDDKGTPLEFILAKRIDSGGRRCYVYSIGSVCKKRGVSQQQALEYALEWNLSCASPPLESEIVWKKIEEAYRS